MGDGVVFLVNSDLPNATTFIKGNLYGILSNLELAIAREFDFEAEKVDIYVSSGYVMSNDERDYLSGKDKEELIQMVWKYTITGTTDPIDKEYRSAFVKIIQQDLNKVKKLEEKGKPITKHSVCTDKDYLWDVGLYSLQDGYTDWMMKGKEAPGLFDDFEDEDLVSDEKKNKDQLEELFERNRHCRMLEESGE